jgi:predicted phage terminase large subunit-like protein
VTNTICLHRIQLDFLRAPAVYRGYVGGRGAGKTVVGAVDLAVRALREPGMFGMYAPTYKMLRDATMREFVTRFRDHIDEVSKADGRITMCNGSEVICRSLEDPETARGPNLSGAWMDEASLIKKDGFDIVIATLREHGRQGWLSATFTPKGKQHWTYGVFGQGRGDAAIFHSKTTDNPFLPPSFADTLRAQYTSQFAAQELEGAFIDMQGTLCRRDWFRIVDAAPAGGQMVRAWDLAATAKTTADYTVGTRITAHQGKFYVVDVCRGQIEAGRVQDTIRRVAEQDGRRVTIYVEQEPGSSGKILGNQIISSLSGYVCRAIPSTGDKVTRAMPFLSQAEAGNVCLVRGPWTEDWLDEFAAFPHGEHDDQVDSATLAFNQLTERRSTAILF